MSTVLQLHAVTRVHGEGATEVHALRSVSFAARAGELVAVMGPSGSGKSTLLTLAGGLDQPTSGTVSVEGVDLASLGTRGRARMRRTSIGYVFQDFNLIPALTAVENVALPRELDGERPGVARRAARLALEEVGLAELADRFPDHMSGGQQQRVAIARAIVGERRLILADEPTGALDTETGEEILRLLRARCDAGAAGVMVTHESRHAAWADRVVFLRDGVVIDESGADPVDALLEPGLTPVRRGPIGWVTGWRMPLRLAWRDAARSRARSVLVLVMIALPVLAVTAADVVMQTSDVSGAESLDRRLGTADARVVVQPNVGTVYQDFDPDSNMGSDGDGRVGGPGLADVRRVLGRDAPALERRDGFIRMTTDKGVGNAEATEIDLADPLADGLFALTAGRLPRTPDEVVVNRALVDDSGLAVGDRLELVDGPDAPTPTIVGIAESASHRDYPVAAGPLGAFALDADGQHTWLLGGGDVSWDQVRSLNAIGATVLSRAVVTNPPPASELPPEIDQFSGGTDDAVVAVAVLVVVMALLEVVLLAGPAFAVSARRQARSLALMAATGGTPAQSRRVVLAGGIVLGGVAAVLGVLLGIATGWALLPLVQRRSSSWFGPFEVPWTHLAGVAGFGLLSALLAAVVPAWIASRQDVVAVLAGRRGDRAPGLRSPILGVVLLGAGVAGAAYGARAGGNGEFFIAGAAIVAVLGMILLVPVLVVGLARLSGRLPLTVRYAVRDAARHRTRTVPAVAAVAATVAGVVALGIAMSSDGAQNEASYTPSLPMGQGSITGYGLDAHGWSRLTQAVEREIPGARVTPVSGVVEGMPMDLPGAVSYSLDFRLPGVRGREPILSMYSSAVGASVLVADDALPAAVQRIAGADRERAAAMLAKGGAVVFTDRAVDADEVRIRAQRQRGDRSRRLDPVTVPALFVRFTSGYPMAAAVLPSALVDKIGAESGTVSLGVSGVDISKQQESDLSEAIGAVTSDAGFYVERGYQAQDETVVIQLILGALGAVLMLGGTLTATFLALSDARPDLATLSAVGASPRMRRGVAAAYALVVGLVGALLGAGVGFIPGVAITYPLTVVSGDGAVMEGAGYATATGVASGPFLDVPWLLILALVVALPLLTAAIVGVTARSRLPLVARLD